MPDKDTLTREELAELRAGYEQYRCTAFTAHHARALLAMAERCAEAESERDRLRSERNKLYEQLEGEKTIRVELAKIARTEEREACAQVAYKVAKRWLAHEVGEDIAAAIRARGNEEP